MKKIFLGLLLVSGLLLGLASSVCAVVVTGTVDVSSYVGTTDPLEFQNAVMTNGTGAGATLSNNITIGSGYSGTFNLASNLTTTGTITVNGTFGGSGADLLPSKIVFSEGSELKVAQNATLTLRINTANSISGVITKTGPGAFQIGSNGNTGITALILNEGTYNGFCSNRIVGATVTLNGGTYAWAAQWDSKTLTNNFVIGTNGGVLNTNAYDVELTGAFTGAGTVTKNGSGNTAGATGTMTLAGTSALSGFTGTFKVNGGSLVLTNAVTSAANKFAGSAPITKTGTSKLTFTGAQALDAYSGTFTISEGEVFLPGAASWESGACRAMISVAAGATFSGTDHMWLKSLTLAEGSSVSVASEKEMILRSSDSNFISGVLTKTGGGILAIGTSNNPTSITNIIIKEGIFDDYGDGGRIGSAAITFDGGAYRWRGQHDLASVLTVTENGGELNTNGFSAAVKGTIAGTGTLTKTGEGTATFSAATLNSFSGTIDVQAGTARLAQSGEAEGQGQYGVKVANGASLTGSGTVHLTSLSLAEGAQISVAANESLTIRGKKQNFVSGVLTKTGAGTLALGTNDSNGITQLIIKQGTFENFSQGRIGTATKITLDGGNFRWTEKHDLVNAFEVTASNGTLDTQSFGPVTVSGSVTGSGILTKIGAGTLVLSGTASDFGGLKIDAGTVRLTNTSPLAASGKTFKVTGAGTLDVASTTKWQGTLDVTDAALNFSATRNLSDSSNPMGAISVTNGKLTFTATNAFGSGASFPTLLTLTNSTFQNQVVFGSTWSNLPAMVLNDSTILQGISATSRIFLDGKITASGISTISERQVLVRSDGHASWINGVLQSGLIEVTDGSTLTINSQILLNVPATDTNILKKSGNGTLVLASSSANSVPIQVDGGVLELRSANGTALGTNLTVNADGTLRVGTLNQKISGALAVSSGGQLLFDLDLFNSSDYSAGTALLTVGSIGTLANDDFAFEVGDVNPATFIEFDSSKLVSGYEGMTANALSQALASAYSVNGIPLLSVAELANGNFAVSYNSSAFPEPASFWLLILGLVSLKWLPRRKRT